MPGLDRPARRRAAAGFPAADLVLLDRTRVRARLGPIEGVLTVEPGTRFDAGAPRELGEVSVKGGNIVLREGRRFAELRASEAVLSIDKRPNEFHVFTIEAERPLGARTGDRFRVDVVQTDVRGVTVGGLAVVFAFD